MVYDIIVLGAGINGLCTAYHLLRRKAGKIAVVDQFSLGHRRGSSHGMSRITRSTYNTPKYVELIQTAHSEEWPRLSSHAKEAFLTPTEGYFFGPGNGAYLSSLSALPNKESRVQVLDAPEARRTLPSFRFPDSSLVIRDLTCSVVAASRALAWLGQTVAQKAQVLENCRVLRVQPGDREILLHTDSKPLRCGRLVVTGGAWLGRLFPLLAPKIQVAHQDVGYFEIEGGREFPVWVYCPGEGDPFYGLPEFGRPGVKVARHRVGAKNDDPDRPTAECIPSDARDELEAFVAEQFAKPAVCIGYEPCLYTNTVNEDFILDHHPNDPRIVIGSACSGHGFKFAPLTGRLLSELLLDGKSTLETFEKYRAAFRIATHQNWPTAG